MAKEKEGKGNGKKAEIKRQRERARSLFLGGIFLHVKNFRNKK